MATQDSIRAKVRKKLQDPDGNRWDDDELNELIDDAQRHYVEETGALRAQAPISVKENEDVYTWPEDCLRVLRIENSERKEVEPSTSADLERQYGGRWRETEGTPSRYYSDLDGSGSFRFYPKADPSFEASSVAFGITSIAMQELQLPIWETPFGIDTDGRYIYALTSDNIYKFTIGPFLQVSKTAHGITLTTTTDTYFRINPEGTIAMWANNDKIYKTTLGSTTAAHITASSGEIEYLGPITASHSALPGLFVYNANMGAGATAHAATTTDATTL